MMRAQFERAAPPAAAAILGGMLFLFSRLGEPLERFSFDALALAGTPVPMSEVMVVKLGESTYRDLKQEYPRFDRSIHARLLRKLKKDGAKLVVFDVFFADATPGDEELARAIREQGNVVLGAESEPLSHPLFAGTRRFDPAPLLRDIPGCRLGAVELAQDRDLAVRRFPPDRPGLPGLHWAAAEAAGAAMPPPTRPMEERWIRYYGAGGAVLPEIGYEFALQSAPGYFHNKFVFIGGRPKTDFAGSKADEFPSALTRWDGEMMSGVEIHATLFLNLLRHEWIARMPGGREAGLVAVGGLVAGLLTGGRRPLRGLGLAALFAMLVWILALGWCGGQRIWFNWMIGAGVQAPLAWAVAALSWARGAEKNESVPGKNAAGSTDEDRPTVGDRTGATDVFIRDYELLKSVGRGAYGEVWLGRAVTGAFRAVKIVYRRHFQDARPFEREFEGVRNFEPISRMHPGWVSILHVAMGERAGYFYYVMEPADDLERGSDIDPGSYQPKTLASVLAGGKRWPVEDCRRLGIALADALEALHRRGLVHRDIKPSNIIFSGNQPKLADIGLVVRKGESQSFVGTEGFIPPEGPGTPLADVYSLGCVLYQAATGRAKPAPDPRTESPEEPIPNDESEPLMRAIQRACSRFYGHRFQSAAELREELARSAGG